MPPRGLADATKCSKKQQLWTRGADSRTCKLVAKARLKSEREAVWSVWVRVRKGQQASCGQPHRLIASYQSCNRISQNTFSCAASSWHHWAFRRDLIFLCSSSFYFFCLCRCHCFIFSCSRFATLPKSEWSPYSTTEFFRSQAGATAAEQISHMIYCRNITICNFFKFKKISAVGRGMAPVRIHHGSQDLKSPPM